VIIKIRLGVMR